MSKLRGGTKYKSGPFDPESDHHLRYVSHKDFKAGKRPKLISGEMVLSHGVRTRAEVREMDPWSQLVEEEYREEYGTVNPSKRGKQQRAAAMRRVEESLGGKDSAKLAESDGGWKYKIKRLMNSSKTKRTLKFRKQGKIGKYKPPKPKREVRPPGSGPQMMRVDFSKLFYTPNVHRPQIAGNSMKSQLQTQPRKLHGPRITMEQAHGMKAIRAGGGKGKIYEHISKRLKDILR